MFSLFGIKIILIFSLGFKASCEECDELCENPCRCSGTSLYCDRLGLTSIFPCSLLSSSYSRLDYSENAISRVNWTEVPITSSSSSFYFDLRHNNISNASGTLTTNVSSNIYLYLSSNVLTSLSSGFLEIDSWQIRDRFLSLTVYARDNYINEVLENAITSNNSLRYLTVDLTNNRISYVHPGVFNVHITNSFTFILRNNQIVSLFAVSFQHLLHLTNVLSLDLSNNSIHSLCKDDDFALQDSGIRATITLKDNPLHCDCTQRWFSRSNSSLKSAVERSGLNQPRCASPGTFRGFFLTSLSPSNFSCPPRLDLTASLDIEARPGDQVSLRCPVFGADPPIQRFEWVFIPSNPSQRMDGWYQFTTTDTNHLIIIGGRNSTGTYQCKPVSLHSMLSVNMTITTMELSEESVSASIPEKYKEKTCIPAVITSTCLAVGFLLLLIALGVKYYFLRKSVRAIKVPKGATKNIHKVKETAKVEGKFHQDLMPKVISGPPQDFGNLYENGTEDALSMRYSVRPQYENGWIHS